MKQAILAVFLACVVHGQNKLPMEPLRDSGQSVTGAFEGWFKNPDGSFSMLVGYFNRNLQQTVDIPVGPANNIIPGGPDRGQPTHFDSGRAWGVFVVTVPANFGNGRLTWSITANGQTTSIPLSLNPLWEISPFLESGIGNTPPVIAFDGVTVQGPKAIMGPALNAVVGKPLALTVRVTDDAKVGRGAIAPTTPPVTAKWSKFRGPGSVSISGNSATFSEPGDYVLLVVANDWSGDGGRGFQCCWSTAQVRVTVRAQ